MHGQNHIKFIYPSRKTDIAIIFTGSRKKETAVCMQTEQLWTVTATRF